MEEKAQTYNPVLIAVLCIIVTGALGWSGMTLSNSHAFGVLGLLLMFGSVFPLFWLPIKFSDNPGLTYFLAILGMIVISISIGV